MFDFTNIGEISLITSPKKAADIPATTNSPTPKGGWDRPEYAVWVDQSSY